MTDRASASSTDPRSSELAAPTTLLYGSTHNLARRVGVSPLPRFDFTLSSVEPRSKIMFLSTSCQSGTKQTTNLKSPNISFKILPCFFDYVFQKDFRVFYLNEIFFNIALYQRRNSTV